MRKLVLNLKNIFKSEKINVTIFKDYESFEKRINKNINGVSKEYIKIYPHLIYNTTNKGCWNCINCTYCTNCINCTDCEECINCTDCKNSAECWNCTNCTDCKDCTECTNEDSIVSTYYRGPDTDPDPDTDTDFEEDEF